MGLATNREGTFTPGLCAGFEDKVMGATSELKPDSPCQPQLSASLGKGGAEPQKPPADQL